MSSILTSHEKEVAKEVVLDTTHTYKRCLIFFHFFFFLVCQQKEADN